MIDVCGVPEAIAIQATLVVVVEDLQLVLVRVAEEDPGYCVRSEASDD